MRTPMVSLAMVMHLLAGQCDSPALDWPAAATCAPPQVVQTVWELRDQLAQVQSLESRKPGVGDDSWCTTMTLASGASEACTPRGCTVADAAPLSCDVKARADQSATLRVLEAAQVTAVETTVTQHVRVTRVHGGEGSAWLFTRSAVTAALGGHCDEPVWLGRVMGFASFGIVCRWSGVLAGGHGTETSVLHVVDLRREGVVDLARFAQVLGVRPIDASRAFPGARPPPAPRPTFRVDGAAIVAPDGRWCFGARGWGRC
jgi:hypothetical protein